MVAEFVAAGWTDGRTGGEVKVEVAGDAFCPPEAPNNGAAAEEVGHDAGGDHGEEGWLSIPTSAYERYKWEGRQSKKTKCTTNK